MHIYVDLYVSINICIYIYIYIYIDIDIYIYRAPYGGEDSTLYVIYLYIYIYISHRGCYLHHHMVLYVQSTER